ncbi:MAG TPA: response regulator transcription factor [Dehalococcoidia bacterium]|nr:response regulator transcription factor [Dehalococcoidia bacterium]
MKAAFIGNDTRVFEIATLSLRLRWPDATVPAANTAADGLALVEQTSPDVLLLHPDVADMSLSQTIQELRRISAVPLLVLGYQGDEMEVITALEAGADDYVRLPCDLTEIMTRVWALLRRADFRPTQPGESTVQSGRLLINPSTYEVFFNGDRLALTSTEFRLLHLLARNRGVVVQHQALERAIWGEQADNSSGLVKKYVQRLRRKLGDDARMPRWIASVHGVGYRFIGPASGTGTAAGQESKSGQQRA